MADPYADTRAYLQQAAADIAAFCMEHYQSRIETAQSNRAYDVALALRHQMQVDIDRLTGPIAKLLAQVPAPPVIVTMKDGKIERIEHVR